MKEFYRRNHLEIFEDFQGIIISQFGFEKSNLSNDDLITEFINSEAYKIESIAIVKKENPEKGYLKQAFIIPLLNVSDFKKFTKNEVIKYLIDFGNTPDWGEDRLHFHKLVTQFLSFLENLNTDDFFIINIEWFEKGNPKVEDFEHEAYIYYFQIFWIDNDSNEIGIAEWFYD